MISEAERAGLRFDQHTMLSLDCCSEEQVTPPWIIGYGMPQIDIDAACSMEEDGPAITNSRHDRDPSNPIISRTGEPSRFKRALYLATTSGYIHDHLTSGGPISRRSAFSWGVREYLPFRRMALQYDGQWKQVR